VLLGGGVTDQVPATEAAALGRDSARRRAFWTLADQAVSSITNFVFSYAVLRSVSLRGFGEFTIVYAGYSLALSTTQTLVCQPLAIRFSLAERPEWKVALQGAGGASVAVGLVGSLVLGVAAALTSGGLRGAFLILAAALPLLLMQEVFRFGFFTAGRPALAFVNDLFRAAGVLSLGGAALAAGSDRLELFVLIWVASGVAAAGLGMLQSRVPPRIGSALSFLRRQRDLGVRFVTEMALDLGASQMALVLIGGIAGLAAVGGLNGARTLLGPLNVLLISSIAFGVPEGVRLRARSPSRFLALVRGSAVVLACLALLLGAGLWALPAGLGQRLVPEDWGVVRSYLVPVTLMVAGLGWKQGSVLGLRVLAAARASLRAQAVVAPFLVLGGLVGSFVGGGLGAAWGLAGATWLGALLWSLAFRRENRALG
jgi:hypothetical protein